MRQLFELSDLVSFGNYLLSEERKNLYESRGKELLEERLSMVSDADLQNWLEKKFGKIPNK